jgi:hypothetical protein
MTRHPQINMYRIVFGMAVIVLAFLCSISFGQDLDSLMNTQDDSRTPGSVYAFTGTHLGNGQTSETNGNGELHMYIGHRFGELSDGFYGFFGLDQATMRLGFDYGISKRVMVGFGRSTNEKTWDLFGKGRIFIQDKKGIPISLTVYAASSVNTLRGIFPMDNDGLTDRMSYTFQAFAARNFNIFSIQLVPVYLHTVFDPRSSSPEDQLSLGVGGSIRVAKRMHVTTEYYYGFSEHNFPSTNPLTIGIDLDTGGHLFQLVLSNSTGMNDKALLTGTSGSWIDGDIYFGFNLTRTFYLW